jgi:hypothetical protein
MQKIWSQSLEHEMLSPDGQISNITNKSSVTIPGSEFRPLHLLDGFMEDHPLWPRVRRMLNNGFDLPLVELNELDRVQDVYDALAYGNHKSASKHSAPLLQILDDEVTRGWQLVIPAHIVPKIPGSIVSPMGVVEQNTIDEQGRITNKWRVTHDQSFKFSSGTSVNSRVKQTELLHCLYGWALKHFLHAIVYYRSKFPNTPLVMAKYDLKAAYRRVHFTWESALKSIVTLKGLSTAEDSPKTDEDKHLDQLALISLRMTFGGSPHPSEFSGLSECIADLTNVLLRSDDWDPDSLASGYNTLLDQEPRLESKTVEFAPARDMLVDPQLADGGAADVFIDDIFNVFPLLSENHWKRGRNAALLAIDCMGRPPTRDDDPLPRDPLVAVKKVLAEGSPSEILTVLGWKIDTRRMMIQLPADKARTWEQELRTVIESKDAISAKTLETIQGRNVHFASIIPGAGHFHNRMYKAIARAKKYKFTKLSKLERDDLRLSLKFLAMAARGMDINLLVSRKPDHMGRSDAYEGGIGGFDLTTGRAWQLEIPSNLRNRKSQNFLEFLACIVQIILLLKESNWKKGDCFLSIGDNISALGWIRKANFDPEDPDQATHIALAREFMSIVIDCSIVLYSQWFAGIDNTVADALSRRHDLSTEQLTKFIVSNFPEQTPHGFHLRALPRDLTLWTVFWLQHSHETKASPPRLRIKGIGGGTDGSISCTNVNCSTTSSSEDLLPMSATTSLERTSKKPEITSGQNLQKDTITWLQDHAVPPSRLWVRASCQLDTKTPQKIPLEKLRLFYNVNSRGMKIMTQQKNRKRQFRSTSSDE